MNILLFSKMSESLTGSFLPYALALIAVLLLASLSGYVSERAGVVNIGIEGMMTVGALIAAVIGAVMKTGQKGGASNLNQIWVVIVAALIAGAFALLHGFAAISLKANQVISGTALNILAGGIALFIATGNLIKGGDPQDINSGYTALTVDPKGVLPVWLLVTLGIALILWLFIKFTKFGMRYKMVGENPNAVDAAGISVIKYRYIAVFLSGFLAGFGGAVMVTTVISSGIFGGTVFGFGFLGLAILIFGQWKIGYITIGTIIFAVLFTLGNQLGTLPTGSVWLSKNGAIFKIFPFVLTIIMMVVFSKWSQAPAADGEPFDKAMR